MSSELVNDGIFMHNVHDASNQEKTIVVFGIPRSGTTMAAKVLRSIGVDMGNSENPVAEDTDLARLLEKNGTVQELRKYIKLRNAKSSIWGWKRPEAFRYRERFIHDLRNPHFVILFRDPLAIALRENISMGEDVMTKLNQTVKRYEAIIRFVSNTDYPCLLISYEKAIQNSGGLVDALIKFSGVDANSKVKDAAIKQIQLNDPVYLNSTKKRDNILRGAVEYIDQHEARGWARYSQHNEYPFVKCVHGDNEIGSSEASKLRPDLSDKLNGDLQVGFHIKFRKPMEPHELSEVKFIDDLLNEPLRIKRNAISNDN